MCDAASAFLAASTGMQIIGLVDSNNKQAQAQRANADMQRQQADNARVDAARNVDEYQRKARYAKGQWRNAMANSGVNNNYGSPLDTAMQGYGGHKAGMSRIAQQGQIGYIAGHNAANVFDWQAKNTQKSSMYGVLSEAFQYGWRTRNSDDE